MYSGQPPDDLLREAKNTRKCFKHVGSIYPGNGAHGSLGSAYRILTEDEVEAVSFCWFSLNLF
jgi:dual specificity protein kinase YAK1